MPNLPEYCTPSSGRHTLDKFLRAQVYSVLHTPVDISFSRCPLKQTSWEHTDIIRRWMGSQCNLSGSISIPKNFRHVSLFEAPSAVNQPACVVNISPNAWNETAVGYLFTNAITVYSLDQNSRHVRSQMVAFKWREGQLL